MSRQFTNKANLPEAFVEAVKKDTYSKGDANISVTGLLKPPRIVVLEEKHENEIVEDVADRLWSLHGQALHVVLERSNRTAIAERRLSIEIEGWKISGGMDLYDERGILTDYKETSSYKVMKPETIVEWTKQLNLYSVILRAHGQKVEKLRVVAYLRDWSKLEALRNSNYPQIQAKEFDIEVWDAKVAEAFMRERIILHKQARISLPECSPEDRWAKEDAWAVMKQGGKKAVRVYYNENEAKQHVGADPALYIQHRPGVSIRCLAYCSVSKFCQQYQDSLKALKVTETEEVSEGNSL